MEGQVIQLRFSSGFNLTSQDTAFSTSGNRVYIWRGGREQTASAAPNSDDDFSRLAMPSTAAEYGKTNPRVPFAPPHTTVPALAGWEDEEETIPR